MSGVGASHLDKKSPWNINVSELTNKAVCKRALKTAFPEWDSSNNTYKHDIEEAKRRGLSRRACARLSGRFGEREIRSIQDDTGSKRPSPSLNIIDKTKKMIAEIARTKEQLSRLEVVFKKVETISRQILDIKNQNDTILNQIGKWQDVIPRLEKNIK